LKEADMAVALKPGWSKPSTILFASDLPPDEKVFAFALSEAAGYGANLIIFHAYDGCNLPRRRLRGSVPVTTLGPRRTVLNLSHYELWI
jgi:hypothetical protein